MEPINFLVTGVGGQGSILSSDLIATVGMAAGYDVRKSDLKGVAMRGGAVVAHVRWGERVYAPVIPQGRIDYLIALELLEGLRWLDDLRPEGTVLINEQRIYPVSVTSGASAYPAPEVIEDALNRAARRVHRIPALEIARQVGNARTLNVVIIGALSSLLPVDAGLWEPEIRTRVPERFVELNLRAFRRGRQWMERAGEHGA